MRFAPSLLRLIERLRGSFAWIEAPELKRRLDHGEAVTVVDVRGRMNSPDRSATSQRRAIFPSPSL
jgi:hypothetical protein